jgi:hypothetical protein
MKGGRFRSGEENDGFGIRSIPLRTWGLEEVEDLGVSSLNLELDHRVTE